MPGAFADHVHVGRDRDRRPGLAGILLQPLLDYRRFVIGDVAGATAITAAAKSEVEIRPKDSERAMMRRNMMSSWGVRVWSGAIALGRRAEVKKMMLLRRTFSVRGGFRLRTGALLLVAALSAAPAANAEDGDTALNLALPTENDALYSGGGPEFYQHIIRDFKGVTSRPWQGGQYGFVRNPQETGRRDRLHALSRRARYSSRPPRRQRHAAR
jgi:hypothetical protein